MPLPSCPPNSSGQSLLGEVLGEYMECLDRGELVDQEHLIARYPELAEDLRSYFAAGAEVERLRGQGWGEAKTEARPGAPMESSGLVVVSFAEGPAGCVDDYELLEQIGQGGM